LLLNQPSNPQIAGSIPAGRTNINNGFAACRSGHFFLHHGSIRNLCLVPSSPEARHLFHDALKMGRAQMYVPSHQCGIAMPQTGSNVLVCGTRHRKTTGKSMTQGVPRHAFQPCRLDRPFVDSLREVVGIYMGGERLTGKHPDRPFPGMKLTQERLRLLIQVHVLHSTALGVGQGEKPSLQVYVRTTASQIARPDADLSGSQTEPIGRKSAPTPRTIWPLLVHSKSASFRKAL
jgi:hypothetical protein